MSCIYEQLYAREASCVAGNSVQAEGVGFFARRERRATRRRTEPIKAPASSARPSACAPRSGLPWACTCGGHGRGLELRGGHRRGLGSVVGTARRGAPRGRDSRGLELRSGHGRRGLARRLPGGLGLNSRHRRRGELRGRDSRGLELRSGQRRSGHGRGGLEVLSSGRGRRLAVARRRRGGLVEADRWGQGRRRGSRRQARGRGLGGADYGESGQQSKRHC